MATKQDQIKTVELMEKYEDGLGHLCQVCAEKFPVAAEFWTEMSTDERTHAFMIRTFRAMLEEGDEEFEDRPYQAKVLGVLFKRPQRTSP